MNRIINMKRVGLSLFFLTSPAFLFAQQPRVLIQTAPDRPVEGSTLTITLLIAHNNPDEINVMAPPFTDIILLDYMLKGPKAISDTQIWTAIEFRFTLNGRGTVTFEPFTIMTPQGRFQTDPFSVVVYRPPDGSGGTGETALFRLSWENAPAGLKIGENAVVTLRVNGWKSGSALPADSLFLPPVPMGHIVESIPLSENEKKAGIALKLRIIPLQTGVLTILNRRLTIENAIYDVPALRIPVNRAKTEQ